MIDASMHVGECEAYEWPSTYVYDEEYVSVSDLLSISSSWECVSMVGLLLWVYVWYELQPEYGLCMPRGEYVYSCTLRVPVFV